MINKLHLSNIKVIVIAFSIVCVAFVANVQAIEAVSPAVSQSIQLEVKGSSALRLGTAELKEVNANFYISAGDLAAKQRVDPNLVLIDTRKESDFVIQHIDGAIRIPLYQIRTKGFLKSKLIVIYNNGALYQSLEKSCVKLRELGFHVWILQGGMASWSKVNDREMPLQLKQVDPGDILLERSYRHWNFVNLESGKSEKAEELFPGSKTIDPVLGTQLFQEKLESLAASDSFQMFLIFNETGEGYESLSPMIQAMGAPVFFLKGGMHGLTGQIKMYQSIREKSGEVMSTKPCAGCP